MKNLKEERKPKMMPAEAVETVEDVRPRFGLFQKLRNYPVRPTSDEFNNRSFEPIPEEDGR